MLKRFLKYYQPHKRLFILDMTVAFIAAIITSLYPALTRLLLKTYIPQKNMQIVLMLIAVMLGIVGFKTICQYIRMRWGHILGVRMEFDMRADIFRHLQKFSFTYFDNVKTGHIMSRISNDLNMIAEVAHHAPEDLVISVFTILVSFIFMFMFNTTLAFIAMIPLPIFVIWGLTYGRKMKGGFRKIRKKIADMNSSVENSVQGIREVKSFANEELEIEKFEDVNINFKTSKENIYGLMATFYSGMEFLSDFFYISVIGVGAFLISKGSIDVPDLLTFTLYISFIMKPIQRLVNFVEQFQQGGAAFERFIEIMDIEPEINDSPEAYDLTKVNGNIEFKNLKFKYESSTDWILRNVNIRVPTGKTVAFVGESGAGKSTLVSLLPRFYEIQEGRISIDNNDIMELTQKSLRENIGIVQQNVFLFDTTIRENIIYGNSSATEKELYEAARKANILDYILSLPKGFDSLVGERGVKLSGGQKQRISIARVFLKNPPILIFDEATSSLDTESEAFIQKAMEELQQNRTCIIIAHRLSTVKNADYLYVLKDGQVVEHGSHQELMNKEDYYFNLYTKNLI